MKNLSIWVIAGIVFLFLIIAFIGGEEKSDHPTLTEEAIMPDKYLENVAYYEKQERYDRSALSLEKAIKSIWKIQSDVDNESFDRLEKVIAQLEDLHADIVKDSLHPNELDEDFNYALKNLTHAELEIAEMYAETDHFEESKVALKYAQLHIKNAMLYHNPFWENSQENLVVEREIFDRLDSLINSETNSVADYVFTIDALIKQVDSLIVKPI